MKAQRVAARALAWGCLLLLLGGCWDMVEVSRSSLITGVALEKGQGGDIRVTVEILNAAETPGGKDGKGEAPAQLFVAEAATIPEAVNSMNKAFDRLLIGSHIQAIVIDEQLAREGLKRFMDFFIRSRYVREDVNLVIARNAHASDLLRIPYPGGLSAALAIQSQIYDFNRTWGGAPTSRMNDYTVSTLTPGRELLLAAVTMDGTVGKNETMDSAKTLEPKAKILVKDAAVFKADKLVGFLPASDTNAALLAGDQLKRTTLSIPLEDGKTFASVRLVRLHSAKRVRMIRGKPAISLTVQGVGFVASLDDSIPLDQASGYQTLERQTEDDLKERIGVVVNKVQHAYGSDIFGFGEWCYRHRYRDFMKVSKDWNELFAEADIRIAVDIQLERSELKTRNYSEIG